MSEQDPLIAAVIGKLPAPGAQWPKADRIAWLRMLAMAADVAYGPAPGIVVQDAEASQRLAFVPKVVTVAPDVTAAITESTGPRFSIDADGFAMRDGLPVDHEDVPPGTRVIDERQGAERGDVASIYWKTGGQIRGEHPAPTHFKLEAR